jgi:hypothetical protein
VYVAVVVGLKLAAAADPPLLLHAYVPPPDAVKLAASPAQIVTVDGLILAVGIAFTVTALEAVAVQLFASMAVTV